MRRTIGANFCQVERIRPVVRSRPCRTSGSQVWSGVSPTLRAMAIVIMVMGMGWESWLISHTPENQALVVLAKSRAVAAVDWARKYLAVASTARGWCCRAIRGRIERVLISSPIHAVSQ